MTICLSNPFPDLPAKPIPGKIVRRALRGWLLGILAFVIALGGAAPRSFADHAEAAPAVAQAQIEGHEAHEGEAAHAEEHAEGKHGLPQSAPLILDTQYFKINSSMVITWVVALFLILFAHAATRKIREVPEGAQNFWEWLVEILYNFLEEIIGHELVRKTFWFFATIFIFILFTNWFGLIPGVGTIGWGTPNEQGALEHITRPILRGGNADLNMTLAMAMVFFACWTCWALKANGPGGFIMHLFGPKGNTTGALKFLMIFIFICVGVLEIVSILFRPVSLSFRLYGNVFAGENMLETMAHLGGIKFGWLVPIPFYFMEILVGIVQALVFTLLTAVFTLLIMPHKEGHH